MKTENDLNTRTSVGKDSEAKIRRHHCSGGVKAMKSKSRKPRLRWWIVLLLGFNVLFCLGLWLKSEPGNTTAQSWRQRRHSGTGENSLGERDERQKLKDQSVAKERLHAERQKLDAYLANRLEQCRLAMEGHYDKFCKEMPTNESKEKFKKALDGVDTICSRDGLCGFKVCAVLAFKMAVDKVKGTNLAEQAISPVLYDHVFQALVEGLQCCKDSLDRYELQIKREVGNFSADCCLRVNNYTNVIKNASEILDKESMRRESELYSGIEKKVKALASEKVLTAGGVFLTALFVKSTCLAIKKVVMEVLASQLAKIVAKNIASASAAGTAAVADGPLPIGDIIGATIEIVGLTWTAYDIYEVKKTMPNEIKKQLLKSVCLAETNSLETCRQKAKVYFDNASKACYESIIELSKENEK